MNARTMPLACLNITLENWVVFGKDCRNSVLKRLSDLPSCVVDSAISGRLVKVKSGA